MSTVTIVPVNYTDVVNAVRYAVKAQGKWATYVIENGVTTATIKDHAAALASLAFPNEPTVQTIPETRVNKDGEKTTVKVRTTYGNAVQAAAAGMRYALGKADESANTPDYLALVRQAAKTAAEKGECPKDAILKAVAEALA